MRGHGSLSLSCNLEFMNTSFSVILIKIYFEKTKLWLSKRLGFRLDCENVHLHDGHDGHAQTFSWIHLYIQMAIMCQNFGAF